MDGRVSSYCYNCTAQQNVISGIEVRKKSFLSLFICRILLTPT